MTGRQKFTVARIAVSALLFVVLMILAANGSINLLLFLIPYLIIGYDVLWSAVCNLFKGQMLDEKFLMSVATVGAVILEEYPEALAVMLFYQIGELFMDIAVNRSRKSVSDLMDITPDHAVVVRENTEIRVEPFEVEVGEIIIIRPGERVPLDGVIAEGSTSLDTVALTGESKPRDCGVGDTVVSGSVNQNGMIKVKVSSRYEDSTVSKILDLVESAADRKTKVEGFITRFARVYTPIVVVCAILLAVVPSLIWGDWSQWIHRALTFLVVSCPCALVISVPLSFFCGIGAAAKLGILVKGSNYLEQLSKVGIMVYDKTGTLTYGKFEVTEICPKGCSESELLRYAATAESYSNHPIAKSVCKRYDGRVEGIKKVTELPGKGIVADEIACGNDLLMEHIGVTVEAVDTHGTVIYIAKGKEYKGYIVISDRVKESAEDAVGILQEMGVYRSVMLTGDSTAAAEAVGNTVGIAERYSHLLPDVKVAKIEEIMEEKFPKTTVCYVGDGINDAPVLAVADVGIAMGALGSDAAIEAADIVLMDDDPMKIVQAVDVSKFTVSIARMNIVFALLVKALALVLGALGITGMWLAVFADVGVAVLAILNAMRTLRVRPM